MDPVGEDHIADEADLTLVGRLLDEAFRESRLLRIILGDQADEDVRVHSDHRFTLLNLSAAPCFTAVFIFSIVTGRSL
ncbi:MAG: hypothetical protein ACJ76Y_28095 [Thermoanaerobaculia bacterium]